MVTTDDRSSGAGTAYARRTRARILAAAERRFKHYGYAKTSVVDVAADCAMSHANVYRFFRNKNEIVDAIARAWLLKSEKVCREVVELPLPAAERLVEFIVTLHRWKLSQYVRGSRAHELIAVASHERRPFILLHLDVIAGLLVEIVEDGNARGEFAVSDPRRLARVIMHATARFCDPHQVARYADEPLEEQARDVMAAIVAGLRRVPRGEPLSSKTL